jgi:hypothetical protein
MDRETAIAIAPDTDIIGEGLVDSLGISISSRSWKRRSRDASAPRESQAGQTKAEQGERARFRDGAKAGIGHGHQCGD